MLLIVGGEVFSGKPYTQNYYYGLDDRVTERAFQEILDFTSNKGIC